LHRRMEGKKEEGNVWEKTRDKISLEELSARNKPTNPPEQGTDYLPQKYRPEKTAQTK